MDIHSVSLKGKRESNEDQHIVFQNLGGRDKKHASVNLYCIFDGHGGAAVSKYLSNNLFPYLVQKKLKYPLSRLYVRRIYNYLQTNLQNDYGRIASHCGSTCLSIIHYKKGNNQYLQIFNVGDCRAIICQSNLAIPLTSDHKPNWFDEKIRINKIGGDQPYFDGEDWRIKDLSVSRAFGDLRSAPYVVPKPDFFRRKIEKNDRFLVLACDGLWDVMSNQDVVNFVLEHMSVNAKNKTLSCQDKRKNIAKNLGEYAIKKGSTDNITIIIVFLN